jgi:hypothetical protein
LLREHFSGSSMHVLEMIFCKRNFLKEKENEKEKENSNDKILFHILFLFLLLSWWKRGESNSCPNIFIKSFLHVYFSINCWYIIGAKQTYNILSWIVFCKRHSLLLQHLVFSDEGGKTWVTSLPEIYDHND